MGKTCRGLCRTYEADPAPNSLRYGMGQKRCTFCEVFLYIEGNRCACCQTVLRTKARSKKR